jgi:hypothetical protein
MHFTCNSLAAVRLLPTPLQFLETLLTFGDVVLMTMALLLAIRLYTTHRNPAFRYLLWACVFYFAGQMSSFLLGFIPGFLFPHRGPIRIPGFFAVHQILIVLFLTFLVCAIKSFIRERSSVATRSV